MSFTENISIQESVLLGSGGIAILRYFENDRDVGTIFYCCLILFFFIKKRHFYSEIAECHVLNTKSIAYYSITTAVNHNLNICASAINQSQ